LAAGDALGGSAAPQGLEGGAGSLRRRLRRAFRRHAGMGGARVPQAHYRLGTRPLFRDHLMTETQKTISPIDGATIVERPLASDTEIANAVAAARKAQREWATLGLAERGRRLTALVDAFVAMKPEIAREITAQMGRPLRYTPNEVGGFEERARYMIAAAPQALADLDVEPKPGFRRFIRRAPLGIVLVV